MNDDKLDHAKKEVTVAFECGLDYVIGKEANYKIVSLSHRKYLTKAKIGLFPRGGLRNLFNNGLRFRNINQWARSPELYNSLYLERNQDYLKFCEDYISVCKDAEIIIQTGGTDILPFQVLEEHFSTAKKVLYFVDDPHATFAYGTPYAFAYDIALYISEAYDEKLLMRDFLVRVGFDQEKIFNIPLCGTNLEDFFVKINSPEDLLNRSGCIYIGGYYNTKAERLYKVAKALGPKQFKIYGKYPMYGFAALKNLINREFTFTGRVRSLTSDQREALYRRTAIGFNLHQSHDPPMECGNARTYELPFRGLAQVLDRPHIPQSLLPFVDGSEVLYYDNINDAIDKLYWLISNPKQRSEIAYRGYLRAIRDYQWSKVVANMLDKIYTCKVKLKV